MPVIKVENKEGLQVDRYIVPMVVRTTDAIGPEHWQVVRDHRREYAQQIEGLAAMQKAFSAEKDYASAKGVKEIFQHAVQSEKAATIVINYFEKPEEGIACIDFPIDLAAMLDYEFYSAYDGAYY